MSWRFRLHSAARVSAGALVVAAMLGAPPFAAGGAGAQATSTGHGLTGRTIRLTLPPMRPAWSTPSNRVDALAPADVETFRTVCVRTCDGYYWPISFSTTRGQLSDDEALCQASCEGGARLFFHANPGGGMADAVDLEGRAYTQLPSAFLYRRKRVEGCGCRPAPWSEAELARHRQYRREAAEAGAGADSAAVDVGVDALGDTVEQPPPYSLGSGGVVLPPARITRWELHGWYGRAVPYRFSGGPRTMSVPPGVVLRRGR